MPRRKFFKFLGSEIPFSAFSAGNFAVNKYEGKCNSYLFNLHFWRYRYCDSVYGKSEKGKTVTSSRSYKQRVRHLPFRRANKPMKCERFISHSDLMIKMLSVN